ncbi:MAG: hypothetical protein ACR2F8_03765 [Caulobacteraceae bacterium]
MAGNTLPWAPNAFAPYGDPLATPAVTPPWQTALAATTSASARIKAAMASGPRPPTPWEAAMNARIKAAMGARPPGSISQLAPRPPNPNTWYPGSTAANPNQFHPNQFQPPNQFRYAARTSVPLPNSFGGAVNAFLNNATANVTYAPPGMDPNAGFQDNTKPPW